MIPGSHRRSRRLSILFAAAFLPAFAAFAADDAVLVPGGTASIRRLLRLEQGRPAAGFLREVNEVLLFGGEAQANWTQVESRKAVVEFVEDLVLLAKGVRTGRHVRHLD